MSKAFGPVMFFEKPIPLPKMVMVRDQAPQQMTPETKLKLALVVELLEQLVAEDRPADVMGAKKAQRRENARRLLEHGTDSMKFLQDAIRQAAYEATCEGIQAAYAARNPHKARKREAWEERLSIRDHDAESVYSGRNPHKRKRSE